MTFYRRRPVVAEQYHHNAWGIAGVELMWVGQYSVYGREEPLALPEHQRVQAPCVRTVRGDRQVMDGDWIVTDEDGRHLYSDYEFRRLFEPVEDA